MRREVLGAKGKCKLKIGLSLTLDPSLRTATERRPYPSSKRHSDFLLSDTQAG
jgi:hypothetical protein